MANKTEALRGQIAKGKTDKEDRAQVFKALIGNAEEPAKKEPVFVAHPKKSDYAAENKSKRLNLLVRPSVYDDIKRLANIDNTTPNNLINEALAAYCNQRKADIQKYYEYHKEE